MAEAPQDARFVDSPRISRRQKAGTIVLVAALHVIVLVALVKGLAAAGVIADPFPLTQAYDVTLPPPPPSPSASAEDAAGKAASEAARAKPRDVAAPKARVPVKPRPVPPAASTGNQNRSGAGATGAGTGGGGGGIGTGSGGSGNGAGGGLARPAEKIAGEINSIRDYPRAGREARIGHSVTIEMTIGTDGRARGCRIVTSSGDARSDQITCRLAEERFRFRPRLNANGEPVETNYRWYQRFFVP